MMLFKVFGSRASKVGITDPDEKFADWVYNKYITKLQGSFEFVKDRADFSDSVATTVDQAINQDVASTPKVNPQVEMTTPTPVQDDHRVVVESAALQASQTLQEAQDKLRHMRHPEATGTIVQNAPQQLSDASKAAIAKNFPEPGSIVTTGDDLETQTSLQQNVAGPTATILDSNAETKKVAPTPAEFQQQLNNQMAQSNRGVSILNPEEIQADGSRVQVVTGTSVNEISGPVTTELSAPTMTVSSDSEVETASQSVASNPSVNSGFQGFTNTGEGFREITVDDIVRNPDITYATQLINSCKNTKTLKTARQLFWKVGNQKMIDTIDVRLASLPPVTM